MLNQLLNFVCKTFEAMDETEQTMAEIEILKQR